MYKNREEAAEGLARLLTDYKDRQDVLVLAIPRGGAVIASIISQELKAPWDLVIPKKIGAPFNPELAIGVVMQDGTIIKKENAYISYGIDDSFFETEKNALLKEIQRRFNTYRNNRPFPELKDKTIILTDDGIATGFTVKGAIEFLKGKDPKEIVLAVPVAPPDTLLEIEPMVDKIICPLRPQFFFAVGQFYDNFTQTTDEEVVDLFNSRPY